MVIDNDPILDHTLYQETTNGEYSIVDLDDFSDNEDQSPHKAETRSIIPSIYIWHGK